MAVSLGSAPSATAQLRRDAAGADLKLWEGKHGHRAASFHFTLGISFSTLILHTCGWCSPKSSLWDPLHMAKILSPRGCPCQSPTFSNTPTLYQPAQLHHTNHLYKLAPPLRWVVCIYALHMILLSLPVCTCTGSWPLWGWSPQFQFDKTTFGERWA